MIFKGVRDGASTAGTARFLSPAKPKAWGGIREATAYGPRAPQPFRRLIALYRSHGPADSRGDLALIIASDNGPLRLSAHAIAERKAAKGSAPVSTYLFKCLHRDQ